MCFEKYIVKNIAVFYNLYSDKSRLMNIGRVFNVDSPYHLLVIEPDYLLLAQCRLFIRQHIYFKVHFL